MTNEKENAYRKKLMEDPIKRARKNELNRKWKDENPDKAKESQKKSMARPEYKKARKIYLAKWRIEHPESIKEIQKNYRRRIREIVFSHYGGICVCCGEAREEFLTLDHINNDGASKRRSRKGSFYTWVKRNAFPNDLQILCWNCNCAKGKLGYCPHEREDFMSQIGIG